MSRKLDDSTRWKFIYALNNPPQFIFQFSWQHQRNDSQSFPTYVPSLRNPKTLQTKEATKHATRRCSYISQKSSVGDVIIQRKRRGSEMAERQSGRPTQISELDRRSSEEGSETKSQVLVG
ncbi:hypothetical protein TNCV_1441601 [Trichonephila clavipes]|uniref:Uncharacterized protein n=1 Tax=Trichonephila clavipes TaxID=2585209 RepID=A0A8X6RS05_TRICX|nr:hypothetical protein TNCV_1441601 [Trichonephila clavipes]